jgi:hypothetical protein
MRASPGEAVERHLCPPSTMDSASRHRTAEEGRGSTPINLRVFQLDGSRRRAEAKPETVGEPSGPKLLIAVAPVSNWLKPEPDKCREKKKRAERSCEGRLLRESPQRLVAGTFTGCGDTTWARLRRTVFFCVKSYTILYASVAISRPFRRFRAQVATYRKPRSTIYGLISQTLEPSSVACRRIFGKNGWRNITDTWKLPW